MKQAAEISEREAIMSMALSSPEWQKRLEKARVSRAQALAKRKAASASRAPEAEPVLQSWQGGPLVGRQIASALQRHPGPDVALPKDHREADAPVGTVGQEMRCSDEACLDTNTPEELLARPVSLDIGFGTKEEAPKHDGAARRGRRFGGVVGYAAVAMLSATFATAMTIAAVVSDKVSLVTDPQSKQVVMTSEPHIEAAAIGSTTRATFRPVDPMWHPKLPVAPVIASASALPSADPVLPVQVALPPPSLAKLSVTLDIPDTPEPPPPAHGLRTDTHLTILVPNGVKLERNFAAGLEASGVHVSVRPTGLSPTDTVIRYFHDIDGAKARAVAEALGGRIEHLATYSPTPEPGVLEAVVGSPGVSH